MNHTEQNKNSEQFGATRTFSVTGHSADTMKNRINSANEQSLSQKNQANGASVRQPNPAQRPVQNTSQRPVQNASQRPVNPAQTQQMRNTQNMRTVQNGQSVRSAQTQRPPQVRNNVSVQQNQNAVQVNRQTAAANTQNRSDANRIAANQTVSGQMSPVRNTAAGRTSVNRAEITESGQSVGHSAQPVQRENKASSMAVVQAQTPQNPAQQKPAVRTPAKTPAPVKETRAQMMKTKATDTAPLKQEEKKSKTEKVSSDEGGNTVVSVIKAIVYIIFVIIISVFLALCIINIGNDVFSFVKSDEIVEVEIPEYATLDEVANILYMNDIIKYPTIFKLYAVAKESDNDFLAGTYQVNGMMNYEILLDEFKEKPETGTVDITIPEGYTIDEMIDLFVNGYGIGTREGFVDVIQNGEFDYWFIKELEENGIPDGRIYRLEGYLFPDTYQFYKASSEYTVVDKMLKRFSQIFTKEYRTQCEVMGYTVDEIVTLASLIEKEAESPSIFFMVSSVFHNRLNAPWNFPKFESDATVAYVLSHENGERTSVTSADLYLDTPYNTYLYDGFPPGPIANPSASAMLAALSPQTTDYYYFVAYKGTTKFSATKAEHDAYIAEIREETPAQQTTGDMPVG